MTARTAWLDLSEAARRLDLTRRQVLDLMDRGELRAAVARKSAGGDGRLRFNPADVDRLRR